MLPLFPLGTVLFPGQVLPLHVFEERYRALVRDLLALPEAERELGVVAIRQGREVGADGVAALYEVGCTARLHRVEPHEDGRFDLVTVGRRLFRVRALGSDRPYTTADVQWLPDEVGDAGLAAVLADAVRAAFTEYVDALSVAVGGDVLVPDLPDDPLLLGHLVAASTQLDLADQQQLLDQPDGCARLRRELAVLRRESGVLRALAAAPAPALSRSPVSLN